MLYQNTKRDGTNKLINLAKALCRLVATFKPIILNKYKDNANILALLAAIDTVCQIVPEAEAEFMDLQGQNDPIVSDPENTPGLDPSAPPAGEPVVS